MKTFALAAAVAAFLFSPVSAADLPVKIRPQALAGFAATGNGFYTGMGVVGAVVNSNLTTPNTSTGLSSVGAAMDLSVGYQFTSATNWYAFEGSVQYANAGASGMCDPAMPCNVTSRWGFEQRFLFGIPTQTLAGILPNFGGLFPALPPVPGGVSPTSHPYIFAGVREDDISASFGLANAKVWKVQPLIGMGLRQQMTSSSVLDISASCTFLDTGATFGNIPGAEVRFGRDCRAAMKLLF